ncbi:MAG: serine hydrolase domain-containing protein, partial [Thermodesulforhabdaceae bacterium]
EMRHVPIWAVLCHAGGWKDYVPFYKELMPVVEGRPSSMPPEKVKNHLLKALLENPPVYKPLKAFQYSDLGYMLAGFIIEEITGMCLHNFFKELANDFGLTDELSYFPLSFQQQGYDANVSRRAVSTGWSEWRRRWLKGEVHDENCFAMGGVAGHAGLFGTARAVNRLLTKLYLAWRGNGTEIPVTKDVIRHFWERRKEVPDSTWAIGFDTPSPQGSTAGRFFSQTSVGHLGFTGTSFWLDLNDGFSVVLLTNRVYYPNTKERMRRFREEIHDLVRMEYGKAR